MDIGKEFVENLGTPEKHQDLSVEYLICEALDAEQHQCGAAVAFLHGMLAGIKMLGGIALGGKK